MKIVIPGGSGHLGTLVADRFHGAGHEVVVLSRSPLAPRWNVPWRVVPWDGVRRGAWAEEIDQSDVVLNLAGYSVNCRYNDENQRMILNSRVQSTRAVGGAIRAARKPPALWLQASTATIYSHRFDAPNDEITGKIGGDESDLPDSWRFSLEVARAWEVEVDRFELPKTRTIKLRTSVVMSPEPNGALASLLSLVRRGLGGPAGSGQQFVSWIHEVDFLRAIEWLIASEDLAGVVNVASPHPLPNADFMRALRRAARMPVGLPASRWMLEIGAAILGTETELVLKSRRVTPTRLLESGFLFDYPTWDPAAEELCARWRRNRKRKAS